MKMIRPELRKRFVDSIECLRKMDFFQDYSGLSSEEILNKIFSGEINYKFYWLKWWREEGGIWRRRSRGGENMSRKKRNPAKELAEELDVFDDMLGSLVEEKDILTHREWEAKIKKRVEEKSGLTSYRELEHGEV